MSHKTKRARENSGTKDSLCLRVRGGGSKGTGELSLLLRAIISSLYLFEGEIWNLGCWLDAWEGLMLCQWWKIRLHLTKRTRPPATHTCPSPPPHTHQCTLHNAVLITGGAGYIGSHTAVALQVLLDLTDTLVFRSLRTASPSKFMWVLCPIMRNNLSNGGQM
jgi:hypothetical protein